MAAPSDDVILTTDRLSMREPHAGDADELCSYYARNAERFERFEPARSCEPTEHARAIAAIRAERERTGYAATFVAFERASQAGPVAVVALDGFSTVPPAAMIGYSVDRDFEGRGFASEAVARVIAYAFAELDLESVSAYYDPANVRSERLLVRVGFALVGRTPIVPGLEHLMRSSAVATIARSACPPRA